MAICSALSGTASSMQETKPSLQMKLYIYNYAHVQNPTLSGAQRELTEIFEAIGVSAQWPDSKDRENPQADSVYSLMIFILGPSGEAAARNEIALGFSSSNQEGRQRPATYVIYPRIEAFVRIHDTANQRGRRLAQVLAHTIAHEIGHVLLGTSAHSPAGIMRASWQDNEYKLLVTGQLRFTEAQTDLIRTELARLSR
jgi:hypothetical protein